MAIKIPGVEFSAIQATTTMHDAQNSLKTIDQTSPRVIVAYRMALSLASFSIAAYVSYDSYTYGNFILFSVTSLVLLLSWLSTVINGLNILQLHRWYKSYNYLVFGFELIGYIIYIIFFVALFPILLLTKPSQALKNLGLVTALSFYAYFGYKFFKIIDNLEFPDRKPSLSTSVN